MGKYYEQEEEGSDSCSLNDSLFYLFRALQREESQSPVVNHTYCHPLEVFRLTLPPSKPWIALWPRIGKVSAKSEPESFF